MVEKLFSQEGKPILRRGRNRGRQASDRKLVWQNPVITVWHFEVMVIQTLGQRTVRKWKILRYLQYLFCLLYKHQRMKWCPQLKWLMTSHYNTNIFYSFDKLELFERDAFNLFFMGESYQWMEHPCSRGSIRHTNWPHSKAPVFQNSLAETIPAR